MFLRRRLTYLLSTLEVLSVCAERRCPQMSHLFSFGGDLGTKEVQMHDVPGFLEDPEQVDILESGERGGERRSSVGGGFTGERGTDKFSVKEARK